MAGLAAACQKGRDISSNVFFLTCRYSIVSKGGNQVLTFVFLFGTIGYGVGYEGYEAGKLRFGLYTPSAEYGYVLTDRKIYLDTIFEKK